MKRNHKIALFKTLITIVMVNIYVLTSFGQWTLATNTPSGAGQLMPFCFNINNKVYMGCGYNSSYAATVSNFEYDPLANSWITKTTPPFAARMGAFSFVIDSFGYVGSGSTNGGANVLNDFWRYNPNTDAWTQMATFPGVGRIEAASFVINGKAYIVSGVKSGGNPVDCWEYDPISNTWSAMNNPPIGFTSGYTIGFTEGNNGYVGIGGWNSNCNNDFWRFEPLSNTWTQMASLPATPSTRTWVVSGVGLVNNMGFIGLGGCSLANNVDFWLYDFSLNTWQQAATTFNFPNGLANSRTFKVGNETFIGTGNKSGGLEDKIYKIGCNLEVSISPQIELKELGDIAVFNASLSDTSLSYTWESNAANLGWQSVPNNLTYTGATSNFITINNLQYYNHLQEFRLIVNSGNGCSDTSEVSMIQIQDTCVMSDTLIITSINEPKNEIIKIYPNPSKDYIDIIFDSENDREIRIYNLLGEIITRLHTNQKQTKISLNNLLSSGAYSIQVETKEKILSFKLIKE